MCLTRLKERVSSTEFYSVGILNKYILKIHKKSNDGSGKANAFESGNEEDFIIGVVYKIDKLEKTDLDKFEALGKGYNEKIVQIKLEDGSIINAQMYFADSNYIDDNLIQYDWYKNYIVTAAKENNFQESYVAFLESLPSKKDLNEKRRIKEENILNLHNEKTSR
jgi:hypothetical protein